MVGGKIGNYRAAIVKDGVLHDSFAVLQKLKDNSGVVHNKRMSDLQPNDLRRRIRELLAIPDRDRTDEEWDELNELEIRTAPGNRASLDHQNDKRFGSQGQPQNHARRQDRNKGERKNGQRQEPKGEAKGAEQRPDGKPREARPDGQGPGRSSRRQHRRPKRSADGNAAPQGATPAGDNGQAAGGSPSSEASAASAPAARSNESTD